VADDSLEQRIKRVEDDIASSKTPLEKRVEELEAKTRALQPKKRDGWDKLQALGGILTALTTALVGYFLTGSVNMALEKRKLESTNVGQMRDLIRSFNSDKIESGDAEAHALTLAAFGEFAVPTLTAALGTNTQARALAAETGLMAVALHDRPFVCTTLVDVLDNRTQRYTWLLQKRTVTLLGKLDCGRKANSALERYLALVMNAKTPAGLATYVGALDPNSDVGRGEVADMLEALCRTSTLRDHSECKPAVAEKGKG
jgi:hypothetical protein